MIEQKSCELENTTGNEKSVKISIPIFCIYVTLICNLGILIGNPTGLDFLVSLSTRILIVTVIGCGLLTFLYKVVREPSKKRAILFFIVVISAVLLPLSNGISVVLNKYVQILCFLMLPCYVFIFHDIEVKHVKKYVFAAAIAYCIVFFALSISPLAYIAKSEYGGISEVLTLGFNNPNEAGIMIMLPFIVLLCGVSYSKKKGMKILFLILACFSLTLIFMTLSRVCIVICCLTAAIAFFSLHKKISNWWITVAFLLPLFTIFIQLLFPSVLSNIYVLGEVAETGRDGITFRFFTQNSIGVFLMGSYKYYGQNFHNSYLSIIAQYGIPFLAVFIWYLSSSYKENLCSIRNCNSSCKSEKLAFVGLLMVIIHGCVEAALLQSGVVYAGLTSLLLILAIPDKEEKKQNLGAEYVPPLKKLDVKSQNSDSNMKKTTGANR